MRCEATCCPGRAHHPLRHRREAHRARTHYPAVDSQRRRRALKLVLVSWVSPSSTPPAVRLELDLPA